MKRARAGEAGYSLVALSAAVTIMLISMAAAVPAWKYVMKNEREEEMIFRANQIADAIKRYRAASGGNNPTSLEDLVKRKFLRKAYKDPMTENHPEHKGRWRLVRDGEPDGPAPPPGGPAGGGGGTPSPHQSPGGSLPQSEGGPAGSGGGQQPRGPFKGVASYSREKSLRVFVEGQTYAQWKFTWNARPTKAGTVRSSPGPKSPGGPAPGPIPPSGPAPGPNIGTGPR